MDNKSDRRTQPRVHIDDAFMYIKPQKLFSPFMGYNGPFDVVDISKSGVGIISSMPINKGEDIKLKIKMPGEKDMVLQGQIRWTEHVEGNGSYRAGIQFNAFGYKEPFNSMENLVRLDQLTVKKTDQ